MKTCSRTSCQQVNPQADCAFRRGRNQCRSCVKVYDAARYAANPAKCRSACARYYRNHKAEVVQRKLDDQKNRPSVYAARAMQRHASQLESTPAWLTQTQLDEIQSFYDIAKALQWLSEEPLEVDHIVPLQGVNVRGLHVPWNLQILPKSVNARKHNRVINDG